MTFSGPVVLRTAGAAMVIAGSLGASAAAAHDLGTTVATVTVAAPRFEILLQCDLDALALGAGPGADSAALAEQLATMAPAARDRLIEDLRGLFARRVRLLSGNDRLSFDVSFPDREAGRTLDMVPPTFLGLTARLQGLIPAGTGALRLRLSRAFPETELTVVDAAGARILEQRVPRGEDSSEFLVPDPGRPIGGAPAGADPGSSNTSAERGARRLLLSSALVASLLAAGWMGWRRRTGTRRHRLRR